MKLPIKMRTKIWVRSLGKLWIIMLLVALAVSCEKEHGTSDNNPPSDHTISKDGFMHKSGLNNPLDNCAGCHGDDLSGGTTGVSCYECHGQEW